MVQESQEVQKLSLHIKIWPDLKQEIDEALARFTLAGKKISLQDFCVDAIETALEAEAPPEPRRRKR